MKYNFENTLVKSGYKLTSPRKKIINWLESHAGTFSVSEILKEIKGLDTVSVYRTIDLLSSLDLVHPAVSIHGEQHYEIHEERNHHHHIVCTLCEKNSCVACELTNKKIKSFKNIHHTVVYTGLCNTCSA